MVGARHLVVAAGLRRYQHLLLLPALLLLCACEMSGVFLFLISCIAPRVRGVCVIYFLNFRIAPGGPKGQNICLQKMPRYIAVNSPGRLFTPTTCKIVAPRGAFTRIITVVWGSSTSLLSSDYFIDQTSSEVSDWFERFPTSLEVSDVFWRYPTSLEVSDYRLENPDLFRGLRLV